MNTNSTKKGALWQKFAKSKKYREEFVAAQVRQGIPFQIRAMLDQHNMSQDELATVSGVDQSTISRAIDPEYGKFNMGTILKIAAGFDVAFIGQFVPFSELHSWFSRLSEQRMQVPSFAEENERRSDVSSEVQEHNHVSLRRYCHPNGQEQVGRLPRKAVVNKTRGNLYALPHRDQSIASGAIQHPPQQIGVR